MLKKGSIGRRRNCFFFTISENKGGSDISVTNVTLFFLRLPLPESFYLWQTYWHMNESKEKEKIKMNLTKIQDELK